MIKVTSFPHYLVTVEYKKVGRKNKIRDVVSASGDNPMSIMLDVVKSYQEHPFSDAKVVNFRLDGCCPAIIVLDIQPDSVSKEK